VAVARTYLWWFVALLAVPAVLAGLALLWANVEESRRVEITIGKAGGPA
jgi:hypothetical protein